MPRAVWKKAALFISASLLASEMLLTGCASLIPPEILAAVDRFASGKKPESTETVIIKVSQSDILARKKILLIVNAIANEEYTTAEIIPILKEIQEDPGVSADIKTDAGFLLSMVAALDRRNKDIDLLQQQNAKCLNDKIETERAIREKDAKIAALIAETQELQYKLILLEETYRKAEKRRGIRK